MTTPAGITLGVVLDSLGTEVLRPLALPQGRAVAIGAPTIYDTDAPTTGLTDAIVLVPGRLTADVLEWAAKQHAMAVVMRAGTTDTAALTQAAERTGVALLERSTEISWGQLYTLIDALRAITSPVFEPNGHRPVDLFALANDIAVRAGGAVAIEDLSMRVLAYSTVPGQLVDDPRRDGILGRRVPDHPTHTEEYAAVLRSDTAVWSYEPKEYRPRLAIAIRDGGEALGTIWVLQGDEPLAEGATGVLAEGARLAAPHLARVSIAADAERRQRVERLGWLLRGLGATRELADSFGMRFDAPATVLVIGRSSIPADHARGVSLDSAAEHVGDLLRMGLSAYRLGAAAGALDGQAVAVVDTASDAPVIQLILATVLARARDTLGGGWRAGISRTLTGLADIPTGMSQARQALKVVCGPFGKAEIGRHDELAASMFLRDVYEALRYRPALDAEPLSTVLDHDARHGTDYEKTLRCWIAEHYDVPQAADALTLHPNTLRHRLRRLAELIDIDDPDLRLALALQLRLRLPDISTKEAE
ncbi:helix-turn-helix domain-containing protein [Streptomyces sp. NPDC046712]|uniref:PucR family transcriptional regulator n=1 Tax=Streptomyces sp. NPDC046712 TaxID=3154802 RepID=UPI0033D1A7B5